MYKCMKDFDLPGSVSYLDEEKCDFNIVLTMNNTPPFANLLFLKIFSLGIKRKTHLHLFCLKISQFKPNKTDRFMYM